MAVFGPALQSLQLAGRESAAWAVPAIIIETVKIRRLPQ
jgi:hypothetical protein